MNLRPVPAGALLLLLAGCSAPAAAPDAAITTEPTLDASRPASGGTPAPPAAAPIHPDSVPYTRVTDAVERAFAIDLPEGWKHDVFLVRSYQLVKPVGTATSPDGATALFFGDATMPFFTKPGQLDPFLERMATGNPLMKLGPYVPADRFLAAHVQRSFGRLAGFRMNPPAPSPLYTEAVEAAFGRMGRRLAYTTASVSFEFTADGRQTRGVMHGATVDAGLIWYPDVGGVVSTADPADLAGLLRHVVLSYRTDADWQRREQAAHEQRMAQLRQDYEQQQVSFRAMNQQHAARMQQLHAASDAHNRQWASQQASIDRGHERFLNLIRGEHTVSDGAGRLFQVDNSHQKYFVNATTNSYVGTDSTTSLDDLRRLGLDPADYREAAIIR